MLIIGTTEKKKKVFNQEGFRLRDATNCVSLCKFLNIIHIIKGSTEMGESSFWRDGYHSHLSYFMKPYSYDSLKPLQGGSKVKQVFLGSSMMGFLIKLSIKNALLKRKKNT
jgi:hypothetical protein